ncbi:hypothetical protein C8J27_105236 [Rhodobacter aestuarii]|uniref:GDSL-like Lipase/Acylhydrolase family protein n=1 Tax=Rhodobacter aestuarii TaxID=453582 RepID=A0A1N7LEZ1_9RHOB|nr:hypothetical protein [Rhodobacter aestuarii]PTV95290.1 hypothetical protein C8J27_105236 [Rhodobacter aestuarii]SIS72341.1 hypothetical protein SAMN05421580_10440 [Rhodobacter aestuarii]
MKPEVLLVGDSHTIALEDGAKELGIATEVFRCGGAGWHDGKFGFNADGIVPKNTPMGRRSIDGIRERQGVTNILTLGVPVITTIGFHLGMLVRGLRWTGHHVVSEVEPMPEEGLVASEAFLTAYVQHHRTQHIRVLKRMAREADVLVVPPPPIGIDINGHKAREILIRLMRKGGLTVFDPMVELFADEPGFPSRFVKDDPNHATADYGKVVMTALRERQII